MESGQRSLSELRASLLASDGRADDRERDTERVRQGRRPRGHPRASGRHPDRQGHRMPPHQAGRESATMTVRSISPRVAVSVVYVIAMFKAIMDSTLNMSIDSDTVTVSAPSRTNAPTVAVASQT